MRASTLPERLHAWILLCITLAGVALPLCGRRMPEARGLDAPPGAFSAERAGRELERIARLPHPVGSGEHECVRERLVETLASLGLACEEQLGTTDGVPLTNLLARIPGSDSTGTVLCLAHYDSVPTGPGAGDDGVGVVAWLEALRALSARGWQPRNDVLLLLSDGEELGLKGAKLFARENPAARDVSVVLNLEAIGNGGPAVLFELGPRNGARVREFARTVSAPTGTSLGDAVYRRMPNDTDLSVFLRRGVGGFNLALTCGSPAYHAPHDTPENLDPRSVQHMGECALALLERTSELDLRRDLDAPDVTFFDVLGRAFVVYPRFLDLVPAALAAVLVWFLRGRIRLGWREALVEHAVVIGSRAVLVAGAFALLDGLAWLLTPRLHGVAGNTTSGALLFAGLATTVAALEVLRADEPEEETERRALAALIVWSGAALVALVLFPGATFVLAGPALAGAVGLCAWRRAKSSFATAAVLVLGLALVLLVALPILHMLVQLFQRRHGAVALVASLVLASGASLFAPHFRTLRHGARRAGPVLFALGGAALVSAVFVARVLAWRQGAPLP